MSVRIRLLGGFQVTVGETGVPESAWVRRPATALVKLLALAPGHRLHREQVLEALWPRLPVESTVPRLHKAAHYARRAIGANDAVTLRQDQVRLLPDRDVEVDVGTFLSAGRRALAGHDPALAAQALELYGGPLLPEDPYEPWTEEPRAQVETVHRELLRVAERWEELVELDPADEEAQLAVARRHIDRGDPRAALRQLERLERAMSRELGAGPGQQVEALRQRLLRALAVPDPAPPTGTASQVASQAPAGARAKEGTRLVGRRRDGDRIRARLAAADRGQGGALVLRGPAGVGKSALLGLAEAAARRLGWRTCRGNASAVEWSWPYAPVLDALRNLCRAHPALLDGLDDAYREELDRALVGKELSWNGESAHQRLFVAAAELVRLAAAGRGLLLVVDDVHDADDASARLLHFLSRCAEQERALVLVAHRPALRPELRVSLADLGRSRDGTLDVEPLDEAATRRLVGAGFPGLDEEVVDEVWRVSGGIPFAALEAARVRAEGRREAVLPSLPAAVMTTLARLAVLGTEFTTDELLLLADGGDEEAYRHLEISTASLVVEPTECGHRFRHPLVREAVLDSLAAHERVAASRVVAERLAAAGAEPVRVAHHLVLAGTPAKAVPFVLRAVETAGALGAYRDALALVDAVVDHAGPGDRGHLLARRGDLLMALGDPGALAAYQQALPHTEGTTRRLVRARLARVACITGDLDTARSALAGLGSEGDRADAAIMLARGYVAQFSGDTDGAWDISSSARDLLDVLDVAEENWQLVDLVALQGLVAHQRGEWFERFRQEMHRTHGRERLAVTVFDAHLCVAEYLLYGPMPYEQVIDEAEELRRRAGRTGALRGIAFATALIGEAALLHGDLTTAERELAEAVALHREIDAPAGHAHSLQRLAEVRLRQGRPVEARELLEEAIPLARWTVISMHLLQRIYGSLIDAAPHPSTALAALDRAEATIGDQDHCQFCDVMLAVPAARACADAGDLPRARRYLALAESSAAHWDGTAWTGAVLEAAAHVARGEGRDDEARELLAQAGRLFGEAGHVHDAERCRATATRSLDVVETGHG
ncbi:ATP-binding protein [Nocardioides caldifontis]|uniref:ATP-binding protein n=1 Tax=Nocardioides caldifontis TaxID=2588938 RepID=UPI001396B463|nr:AAA family ATPase [Nocardioides caldifontis]